MNPDDEHLSLLAIFHYVFAGMMALFACFPILHILIGTAFVLTATRGDIDPREQPPVWFGWLFIIAGASAVTIGWTMAAIILAAGRMLARKRRYLFCLIVAGIECVFVPLGTILGVFTIIVLGRPSVKAAFEANASCAAGSGHRQEHERLLGR